MPAPVIAAIAAGVLRVVATWIIRSIAWSVGLLTAGVVKRFALWLMGKLYRGARALVFFSAMLALAIWVTDLSFRATWQFASQYTSDERFQAWYAWLSYVAAIDLWAKAFIGWWRFWFIVLITAYGMRAAQEFRWL